MAESTTTVKDSDVPEDCDICHYAFTKTDRCPKILPCGHTICANCINTLVMTNPKICPKCRRPFEGRDAYDFATHMDVINKISQSENEPEKADLKGAGTVKTSYEDSDGNQFVKVTNILKEETEDVYQANLTRYANADLDIQKEENYILELKESLLALNVDIESVIKVLKEVEAQNIKTVSYLEGARQLLQNRQKVKTERVKTNEDNGTKIRSYHDLTSLGPLADKFKELNEDAKEFEQNLNALITKSEEIRLSIKKDQKVWRKNIDKIQAIPSFKEEGDTKSLQVDLAQEVADMKYKYEYTYFKADDLRKMPDHIRRKIEEEKIFVRQLIEEEKAEEQVKGEKEEGVEIKVNKEERKQKQRIGRLSISNEDGLLLHHMTEEEDSLPLNSYVVEYSEIMQMVDPSSRLTFIDLERKKNLVGRVLIGLSPDTAYGREFFFMCSGEMGTSYAGGKRVIGVWRKGDGVSEGLVLQVNETLLNVNWESELEKEEYGGPLVAGTLLWHYRSEDDNGVQIFTKNNPQLRLSKAFGKVYKGMEVVERLCSFAPGKETLEHINCRIKDCGVVIRTP